jgi:hypothetical protein
MPLIDPTVTWRKAEERLAAETDPVLRGNLELLIEHMKAEASLDLDRLMATVSPSARYVFFGDEDRELDGKDAVRGFYTDFAASGAHKLQFDVDRLVVDRSCILTEGTMRMAYPGRTLAGHGIEVDDPDAHYLYEARMAVIWPIADDGLFVGEDSYTGGDGFAGIADRKLAPSDIAPWEPEPVGAPG